MSFRTLSFFVSHYYGIPGVLVLSGSLAGSSSRRVLGYGCCQACSDSIFDETHFKGGSERRSCRVVLFFGRLRGRVLFLTGGGTLALFATLPLFLVVANDFFHIRLDKVFDFCSALFGLEEKMGINHLTPVFGFLLDKDFGNLTGLLAIPSSIMVRRRGEKADIFCVFLHLISAAQLRLIFTHGICYDFCKLSTEEFD